MNNRIVYKEESYKIMGACYEVYKEMGCGFLESVYHECLELELQKRIIDFSSKQQLKLKYKDKLLSQFYVPDFICYGKIVLEIKAVSELAKEHQAQVLNYLHATGFNLGLLVNFGHFPKLEYKRIVL